MSETLQESTRRYIDAMRSAAVHTELANLLLRMDPKVVSEATLSRVLRHTQMGAGFAMLSADRSDRVVLKDPNNPTQQETEALRAANNIASTQLRTKLIDLGYPGFIPVRGAFAETNRDTGEVMVVSEQSYFVPNVTWKDAEAIAELAFSEPFRQQAILWGSPQAGIYEVRSDGTRQKIGDELTPDSLSQAYTQLKPTTPPKIAAGRTPRAPATKLAARFREPAMAGAHESQRTGFLGLLYEASSIGDRVAWLRDLHRAYSATS
ncbi:MAG: hypothetical protein E6R03_01655 [Hyphomicrobiaceae bacterium]|nr:MAG: hypothetical protein E6R03_01655 [Hyphomicrobiaceae bacterium]